MKQILTPAMCNTSNITQFLKHGTYVDDENIYNCTACGRSVSISNSFSNQGSNLICTDCYRKFFRSGPVKLISWEDSYIVKDSDTFESITEHLTSLNK